MNNNKDLLKIGLKLREYRIRAGFSQLEVEMAIAAGSGSISRIENGQVNPTKETLIKIIDILNLNYAEASTLFDIAIDLQRECLIRLNKILSSSVDLDNILQISANMAPYELDYLGSFLVLVKGDYIFSTYPTQNWASELSARFLPRKFQELHVNLANTDNLMVKTIVDNKIIISNDMKDFICPAVNKFVASMIIRISKVKSCISLPLFIDNNVIGAIFFGKNYRTDFLNEIDFLKEYSGIVAQSIMRVKYRKEYRSSVIH